MSLFLSASDLIMARLVAQVGLLTNQVRAAVDVDWVIKNPLSSSIAVIFFDDIPDTRSVGQFITQQSSEQFWLVLVSVRNVQDQGNASLQEAGVISELAVAALQGYTLSDQHSPLVRVRSPFRKTTRDGYTHLPFMFSTKIVMGNQF